MREKMQRFSLYMELKSLNDNQVTKECGLSKGLIGQARTGKSDLGAKAVDKISSTYTDLNRVWLLTGEGEMLNTPSAPVPKEKRGALTQTVQYFPEVEATGGHMDLYEDRKENSVSLEIPRSFDCDYALNLAGDSMAPLYNPGCIILIKRWTERFIEYGRVYLIVTKMGNRMVKYIRPASDEAYIICASENPAYHPFEVAREDILALYAVKGCIFQHSM